MTRDDRSYLPRLAEGHLAAILAAQPGGCCDGTVLPLDDVSFLYHVRRLPLEVGRTLTEHRHYKSEGNPVTVHVLRRERINVPADEFDAIVIRPIIRTGGLFREGGEADSGCPTTSAAFCCGCARRSALPR